MTTMLVPVTGKARIEVLDILRGIAILGIFYMNIPFMGSKPFLFMADIRSIGWSVADRNSWATIQIIWEGTQRCLLEFLFGAGMMVLTARAMEPDGPVAIADLYYRRNLWLLLFGLADIFVLLWPGDILHIYALSALFLFPFRKLAPRWLLTLGLIFATFTAVGGAFEYRKRVMLIDEVAAIHAKQAAHVTPTSDDKKTLGEWRKVLDSRKLPPPLRELGARDEKARGPGGTILAYASDLWSVWLMIAGKGGVFFGMLEAFSAMLIGVALWKWRIIQGGRTVRFYLATALLAYGFGITARALGVSEQLTFSPMAKTFWITGEYARLAVGLGHVALVNLIVKSARGRAVLAPFRAAGRTAFSLYFLQQIIGIWMLFAPFALGLWGRYSWGMLTGIATCVIALELVLANIWMHYFFSGPFEWAWRSLAYVKLQPFRRMPGVAAPVEPLPGPGAIAT